MTLTIQIGNSDNKLTQQEWALFIHDVLTEIKSIWSNQIHFSGGSNIDAPWQNYCWVIECGADRLEELKESLTSIRKTYNQDSVALTIGETSFI